MHDHVIPGVTLSSLLCTLLLIIIIKQREFSLSPISYIAPLINRNIFSTKVSTELTEINVIYLYGIVLVSIRRRTTDWTEIGESNPPIRFAFRLFNDWLFLLLVYRLRRRKKRMYQRISTDTDLSVKEKKRKGKKKKNVDQSRDIFALIKRSSSQTDRYRSCKSVVEKGERIYTCSLPLSAKWKHGIARCSITQVSRLLSLLRVTTTNVREFPGVLGNFSRFIRKKKSRLRDRV